MHTSGIVTRHRTLVLALLVFLGVEAFGKQKFEGLFGSYRRDTYTENEGRDNFLGTTLSLSTLIPATSVVKSSESSNNSNQKDLAFATFFNIEAEVFYNLWRNWQIYGKFGYFSYDTRKENEVFTLVDAPTFHEFSMKVIPAIAGIKYRFGTEDIVPYIGAGLGLAYVERHAGFDYNRFLSQTQFLSVLTGEVTFGLDFYFASRSGIRLEVSGYYLKLPTSDPYNAGGSVGQFPIFNYQANVLSVRYSSGVFILF